MGGLVGVLERDDTRSLSERRVIGRFEGLWSRTPGGPRVSRDL